MPRADIPFFFDVPVEVWHKAGTPGQERRIGGIISTEMKDKQGETVLQRGLDFSDFLASGWLNDNHSKKTTDIVGYPLKVEPTVYKGRPATRFEGYLLQNYGPADEIWRLANSLQATQRRLGFSIEGNVVRRDGLEGEIVAKAKVRNVAVTACPVNGDTRLEILAKSLQAMQDAEPDTDELIRALAAGGAIGAPGAGRALMPQSLETVADVRRAKRKTMTKSEVREYLARRYPGMASHHADRILNYVTALGASRGE